jgi:hypothetical protein
MATIVNLNLGGGTNDQVYTADLILTSPYTDPTGNLLVLRSRPDVEPITGTLAAVESTDSGGFDGRYRNPVEPVQGVLSSIESRDSAVLSATGTVPAVTGSLSTTDRSDSATAAGEAKELQTRTGTLGSAEVSDVGAFSATYTLKWVAGATIQEATDLGQFAGEFIAYTGPGFLNSTERVDNATMSGRVKYDVAGDWDSLEGLDDPQIIARTALYEVAESTDVVFAREVLTGDAAVVSLVDRIRFSDLLDDSRDMVFADQLGVTDTLSGILKVSLPRTDTVVARDVIGAGYAEVSQDTVLLSEALQVERPFVAHDQVVVSDTPASVSRITGVLQDSGRIQDDLGVVFGGDVSDTLITTDTLSGEIGQTESWVDRVLVGEALAVTLHTSSYVFDGVQVSDVIATGLDGPLTDTGIFADLIDGWVGQKDVLSDQVVVADQVISTVSASSTTVDTVQASDVIAMGLDGPLADTGVVTDLLDGEIGQLDGLTDKVFVGEAWSAVLTASAALSDTVSAQDDVSAIVLADALDTVVVSDVLAVNEAVFAALEDTVFAADGLIGTVAVYAPFLADTLVVTDGLTSHLGLVGVLSDTVLYGDTLHEATQKIIVVNADTGAVSTYTFTPTIKSVMHYQGVLYLAGPEGLYALDAVQDDDGAVVWTLRTGFSNLGTDQIKRVQDVNFQARTEGGTTFQVVSDRYGQKQEWNYRLPPLTRNSYRDGVVKVGKGIQSVYWQFAAQGVGPAEIDQLRFVVEPLSRRR